ncbi:uncharacterized protein LOC143275673 [Babylonia areolata]|uniref:uncharacterized protein LOC143275673 n=1 Tax=Babylonia areolata TaxID=304850 RepID=UPI003FCF44A4
MAYVHTRVLALKVLLCVLVAVVIMYNALAVVRYVYRPLYFYNWPRDPIDPETALRWTGQPPARGDPQWQRLDSQGKAFVYAAHYDDIKWPPLIRVIATAEDPLPYFYVTCRFYDKHDGDVIASVTGSLLHFRESNERRYLGSYVECPVDNILPVAVTVDTHRDHGLNYMHVRYSHDVTWPDHHHIHQAWPPQPSSPLQGSSQSSGEDEDTVRGRDDSGTPQSRRNQSNSFLWNVTRCIPAFQMGFDDHVKLAEMVAISRLLGVQHFVFYLQHAGPHVLHLLKVLQAQGDVEVHTWNLNLKEKEMTYAGELASINDCLYRHLWTSRYLLFGDVDELFVQRDSASITDLLDQQFSLREECGAFLFLNVFFNMRLPTSRPPNVNTIQAKQLNRCQILTHTRRHIEVLNAGVRSKPVVDPRKVKTVSVHILETLRHDYKACTMDTHLGLLHHYRDSEVPPEDKLMDDPYLWGLFDEILDETSYILEEYDEMNMNE